MSHYPLRAAPLFLLPLLLSACVPAAVREMPAAPSRAAAVYGRAPEGLAGATAHRLIAMFGQPRLDIRERTARKLQFANGRCVLDAYLYAPAQRKEAVVAHVDARLTNGQDTDASACIQSLRSDRG